MRLSKLICFLLLILCLCPEILHARKKVGLVLGGGGTAAFFFIRKKRREREELYAEVDEIMDESNADDGSKV